MEELCKLIIDYVPWDEQEENDKRVMLKYIKEFDDVLTRQNEMFHFSTSAWVVNSDRTKVLMVYHNIFDSCAWIGGHADGNSNLLEVVQREILEETGLEKARLLVDGAFGLSIQTVKSHQKNGRYVSAHLHYDVQFLFQAEEDETLKIKNDENSDVSWIDTQVLLDIVTEEHMKPLYEKLIHKVQKIVGMDVKI